MGEIIAFPGESEREWKVWEQAIRANPASGVSQEVVEESLPAIKEHWTAIFQNVSLEVAKSPVPGPLSRAQAQAIQDLMSTCAGVVVDRLKHERAQSLGRLINAEILLTLARRGEL